jgi:T5SS/PEP-CTERM-associated repeat protein
MNLKSASALRGAFCLPMLVLFGSLPATRADSYNWAASSSGDFGSANWVDNDAPVPPFEAPDDMVGPPGGGDSAYVPENTILSGSGNVGTLDTAAAFGGGLNGTFSCDTLGSVLLTGGSQTAGSISSVRAGTNSDSAEDIIVQGAHLTAGSADHPAFGISGGGSVIISSTIPEGEGNVSGQGSTLTINGALMNFNGGPSAGGTVSAASIQSNNGSTQADGAGSLVTVTGNAEYDGQQLDVTNGAEAAIGGDLLLYGTPANLVGGGAIAYLDGAGTTVTVGGEVIADSGPSGGYGYGSVLMSNGALLHSTGLDLDTNGSHGQNTMSNGAQLQVDSGGVIIGGNSADVDLSLETACGITLTGNQLVAIGFTNGSSGEVDLDQSSSFNATGAMIGLGVDAGSQGTLDLSDSSTMQLSGTGAFLHVGESGSGNLQIFSGSTVQIGAGVPFEVGSEAGSGGSMQVDSTDGLTLSGSAVIGNQGMGQIYIQTDPTLSTNAASMSASGNFYVGGDGSLAASTGNGLVTVDLGGQLSLTGGPAQDIGLGNGKGAIGEIWVDGAGSSLTMSGATIAGVYGQGQLAASNGATAQSLVLQLGSAPGAVGSLLIYNSGTTWTNTTSIFLGNLAGQTGGKGNIAVNDSGLLRIYQNLSISNQSLVDVAVVLGGASPAFPSPAPPTTSTPKGRIFVGSDDFGPDGAIRVGQGGVLTGKGKQAGTKVLHTNVIGDVVIGLGGKFQPGGDPDAFSIKGDCDLSDGGKAGGETDIEVAGTGTAGTDYDQIAATGKVTLGGTLKLVLMEGYKPQAGDTIQPVQAKTTTGNFKEVVTPGLTLSSNSNAGKLSVKVMSVANIPAPMITSEKTATAHVGKAFSYQIVATGLPAGYAATGLPAGLDIDPSTGLISGTPTAAGSSSVTISSTSVGGTGKETLQLKVAAPVSSSPAIILSAASVEAVPEAAFSYQIMASNSPANYAATGLPPGLSVNTVTGVISGKPTQDGNYMVTLSATNATGTGTAKLKLVVALPAVKVTATVPEIAVGSGKDGEFTISIPAALKTPLTIHYKISGSAEPAKDYVALGNTAVIKAGQTMKVIKVVPRGDLDGAMNKVVQLTLVKAAGYTLHAPEHAKVKIVAGE